MFHNDIENLTDNDSILTLFLESYSRHYPGLFSECTANYDDSIKRQDGDSSIEKGFVSTRRLSFRAEIQPAEPISISQISAKNGFESSIEIKQQINLENWGSVN